MVEDRFEVIKAFEHFVKYRGRKYDFSIRNAEKDKITFLFRTSSEVHMFYFVIYNSDKCICYIFQTVIKLDSAFKVDWHDEIMYKDYSTYKAKVDLSDDFWKKEFFNQTLDDWFLRKIKENKNMSNNVKIVFYEGES